MSFEVENKSYNTSFKSQELCHGSDTNLSWHFYINDWHLSFEILYRYMLFESPCKLWGKQWSNIHIEDIFHFVIPFRITNVI